MRQTKVGDRYVLEAMKVSGYSLGGEQSGHVIISDHATTGDGILTALHVLERMAATGRTLADLASVMTRLPQVLVNVAGVDKSRTDEDAVLAAAVAEEEAALGDTGRVLLRPSGTEPLVRVMVEAESGVGQPTVEGVQITWTRPQTRPPCRAVGSFTAGEAPSRVPRRSSRPGRGRGSAVARMPVFGTGCRCWRPAGRLPGRVGPRLWSSAGDPPGPWVEARLRWPGRRWREAGVSACKVATPDEARHPRRAGGRMGRLPRFSRRQAGGAVTACAWHAGRRAPSGVGTQAKAVDLPKTATSAGWGVLEDRGAGALGVPGRGGTWSGCPTRTCPPVVRCCPRSGGGPHRDPDLREAAWTPERLRENEDRAVATGRCQVIAVAVAPDGTLGGLLRRARAPGRSPTPAVGGTLGPPVTAATGCGSI